VLSGFVVVVVAREKSLDGRARLPDRLEALDYTARCLWCNEINVTF
jgi:hypothetical protein